MRTFEDIFHLVLVGTGRAETLLPSTLRAIGRTSTTLQVCRQLLQQGIQEALRILIERTKRKIKWENDEKAKFIAVFMALYLERHFLDL